MSYNYLLRFIQVGDSAVGKSCMLVRYEHSTFKMEYQATIGIEFASKLIDNLEQPIKLEIWDTSGQEVFRSIARSYYRNCSGVVIVYDITDRKSFQNVQKWAHEVQQHANEHVSIILVGNKSDLSNNRSISFQEGQEFASKKNYLFMQCSAKTGENITKIYQTLAEDTLQKIKNGQIKINSEGVDEGNVVVSKKSKTVPKKYWCC